MTKLKGICKFINVVALLWMMGCSTTSYRNNNNLLLRSYKVEWPKNQKIEDKSNLTYAIKTNLKPKQNGKFLLIPRIWFYYKANQPSDTTKFDKWQREVIGEEPAIIRRNLLENDLTISRNFLQAKGYLDAKVSYIIDTLNGYKGDVTFLILPGEKYLIDTIIFSSPDLEILQEINKTTKAVEAATESKNTNNFSQKL